MPLWFQAAVLAAVAAALAARASTSSIGSTAGSAEGREAGVVLRQLRPWVAAHCLDCHDAEERRGGLDLEVVLGEVQALSERETWKRVLDQVEAGMMPPPKRDRRPSSETRAWFLNAVEAFLALPDPELGEADPGRPILRRLTRYEYNRVVRDLFGLDRDLFMFPERLPIADRRYFQPGQASLGKALTIPVREAGARYPVLLPQAGLPGDLRTSQGFANRGDAQSLSALLLEKYLSVAGELVHHPELPALSPVFAALVGIPSSAGSRAGAGVGPDLVLRDADPAPPLRSGLVRAPFEAFLERAFRRPVSALEAGRFFAIAERAVAAGRPAPEALRAAVQAVLASPEFLFVMEPLRPAAGPVRALDDHELASRLSLFLWGTLPDAALLELAGAGRLHRTGELVGQARRMVKDPKVAALSESFAVQWLRLDQLPTTQPDPKRFRAFYSGPQGKNTLHNSLLLEALLLFETVLVEDRSILEFVAADYTWLNARLARFYGLESEFEACRTGLADGSPLLDSHWFRCRLSDARRGGYLTMGGPLTLTSLPDRTSPVKRGAWLLETIFRRPPPEPKVAFALETDTSGSDGPAPLTIRQRFEEHRSQAACWSCHQRLDPPGFALEVFDAVGRLRNRDGAWPVDARGEWARRSFNGPAEFKDLLLDHPQEFVRGFIEHLLSYALGRELTYADVAVVRRIQEAAGREDFRFSAIIEGIVSSRPFRFVRNLETSTAP